MGVISDRGMVRLNFFNSTSADPNFWFTVQTKGLTVSFFHIWVQLQRSLHCLNYVGVHICSSCFLPCICCSAKTFCFSFIDKRHTVINYSSLALATLLATSTCIFIHTDITSKNFEKSLKKLKIYQCFAAAA